MVPIAVLLGAILRTVLENKRVYDRGGRRLIRRVCRRWFRVLVVARVHFKRLKMERRLEDEVGRSKKE